MILVLIAVALLALLVVGVGFALLRVLQIALAFALVIGFIVLNLVVWTSVGVGAAAGAVVSAFSGPGHDALPWLVAISVSIFTAILLLRALLLRWVAWLKLRASSQRRNRAQPL